MYRDEGYLLTAFNTKKEAEVALNLCMSLKYNDDRPVALLHNYKKFPTWLFSRFFDYIIRFREGEDGSLGSSFRFLSAPKYSPFHRTMYLRSNCLLMKKDMDKHWDTLKGYVVASSRNTLFYFDNSPESNRICGTAVTLSREYPDKVYPVRDAVEMAGEDTLKDYSEICMSTEGCGKFLLAVLSNKSRFERGGIRISPSICEFYRGVPKGVYKTNANWLREHFEVYRWKIVE